MDQRILCFPTCCGGWHISLTILEPLCIYFSTFLANVLLLTIQLFTIQTIYNCAFQSNGEFLSQEYKEEQKALHCCCDILVDRRVGQSSLECSVSCEMMLKHRTLTCHCNHHCFIICTHYLKHSGRNTGTLRWITMTKRSILQRASGLWWCIKIFSQVQHRFTVYFQHSVLRWEAKLLSSFHFLVKNVSCWLWLTVWKNFQTSVCAVFQNFDISNPEGQHRCDLILPLFSLK